MCLSLDLPRRSAGILAWSLGLNLNAVKAAGLGFREPVAAARPIGYISR
jgi:hypothetical protein